MTAGLVAAAASWGVFWGGWAALLPAVAEQVGASVTELGLALFAIPLGALPAMLLTGRLVDRYGGRVLLAALTAFAVAVLAPGLAHSLTGLAAGLLLVGAISGAIEVGLNAVTAEEEARTGRRLFNLVHAATPLAMLLAAPAVGLARQFGATPLHIVVAMAILVAVSAGLAAPAMGTCTHSPSSTPPSRPLLSGPLLVLGLTGAAVLAMESAVEQWSAVHLERTLGASAFVASLGPAAYLVSLAVGRLVAARVGASVPHYLWVAAAGLGSAVGLLMAATAGTAEAALAGFAIAGLGNAAALPTLLEVAGATSDAARRGAAVATVTTTSYLGFLASPALVGALAAVFALSGALAATAALGAVVVLLAATSPTLRARV